MLVGRIKHFGDNFGFRFGAHSIHIIALGERFHVEVVYSGCSPQAKHAYSLAVIAADHYVIGDCFDNRGVLLLDMQALLIPTFFQRSAKLYDKTFVRTRHHPDFAGIQPHVGQFNLLIIYYFLLEKAIVVAYGKAHCGIVAGSQAVHKACGKTA